MNDHKDAITLYVIKPTIVQCKVNLDVTLEPEGE